MSLWMEEENIIIYYRIKNAFSPNTGCFFRKYRRKSLGPIDPEMKAEKATRDTAIYYQLDFTS